MDWPSSVNYTRVVDGNSVLRQLWDDGGTVGPARTYHEYDAAAVETLARAYTTQENADADARATAATRASNLQKIYTAMQNARANNTTFLGIASPTNAQIVSQVQALTRQNNGIMRVVYGLLNGDPSALDGTN
jgi:hypothetical protein